MSASQKHAFQNFSFGDALARGSRPPAVETRLVLLSFDIHQEVDRAGAMSSLLSLLSMLSKVFVVVSVGVEPGSQW